uniref:MAK10-like protein n=1 Tax=Tanacetum cinerariifolium TaxID=118510 RepID=A0A699I682_TANCI|nr:MAK10-like protein [Tanacetum cinerariifolium]
MSSNQVLKSWLKEASTLGENVSLEKSNKNVIGPKNVIGFISQSSLVMITFGSKYNKSRYKMNHRSVDRWDFAKPIKAISLPQDVPSTSDRCLIELENQVQCFMEGYLAPKQPIQVNKITLSCEICSGPHDTQYCMENPEQAFVDIGPHIPTKQEASGTLSNLSKIILVTPTIRHGVVRFTNEAKEIAYKMPYKIDKYNSLSYLQKEHTKPVYHRNEKDKRRLVDYVMSKILGFYKECLELGPEYITGLEDERDVSLEVLRKFQRMILGGRFNQLSHVSSPLLSKPEEY